MARTLPSHALDRLLERSLQVFAFLIPFEVIGGTMGGGYILSVATIALLFADFLILIRGRFLWKPLAAVVVFLLWCFLTAVGRYPVPSYLPSLLALTAMLIPIVASTSRCIDPQKILKALVAGLLVSFLLAAWDVGVNLGLPPITETVPIGLWGTDYIQESVYFGVYRVKSAQTEPSHYAHYLAFMYAVIDQADRRDLEVPRPVLLKVSIVFFLLMTISLSGLIMFIGYLGAVFFLEWRERILRKVMSPYLWLGLPIGVVSLVIVLQQTGQNVLEYPLWLWGRVDKAIAAIRLGLVVGSEASRAGSAAIVFEYWTQQDWLHTLTGEGYANHEHWLLQNYGYLSSLNASFARGDLHNNFAMVGIATGVIGFVMYIVMITSFAARKRSMMPFSIFSVWIIGHFAMGYFAFYRFWWPIILGGLIFGLKKNKQRR